MLDGIDAGAVRRWTRAALDGLGAAREEIDALNVYPVPDGDTGTNLFLTVESAAQAVTELPPTADLARTVQAMAHGALMGARGNSGIILSQLLGGVAGTLSRPPASVGSRVLADALVCAADMAYAAVARPVEGTMLSVARAAADAACAAADAAAADVVCAAAGGAPAGGAPAGADLPAVVQAAAQAAHLALARTPDQLEILRRAGVVDAGGRGVTVLLDALVGVVTGAAPSTRARGPLPSPPAGEAPPDAPAFEVMYLLDADEPAAARLREALAVLGQSVVVVGGDGLWNVHAHVDDVGAAVEAGLVAGRPRRIRVTSFAETAARRRGGDAESAPRTGPGAGRAVVSVAAGDGLALLFERAGATVVRGGPGRRASTGELLDGVRRAGAREVVVLPNDSASLAVAEAAATRARLEGIRIAVVPTVATVQALAALAVHEPGRRFEDDVVHMTAAAGHARHGGVTVASKDAMTAAGLCRRGDVLGIVDGDFVEIGSDLGEVARRVVDRLLAGGGELVTLVTGQGGGPGLAPAVVEHLDRTRPDLDAVVYEGGQPRYPLLVSVE